MAGENGSSFMVVDARCNAVTPSGLRAPPFSVSALIFVSRKPACLQHFHPAGLGREESLYPDLLDRAGVGGSGSRASEDQRAP